MNGRRTLAGIALILLATSLAYLPSIDGDFVLDDYLTVQDPIVAAPLERGLGPWLASPRPVLTATFAMNHAAVGIDTRSWHLTNLLVHLAAVLLAWRVALRLLARAGLARPEGAALFAAALFALHPLQTESVAYVTQRAESLASAFYLAALLALLARDGEPAPARRRWLLAAAAGLELLGLLVKPVVATLPAAWLLAVLLLPAAPERGRPVGERLRRWLLPALPLLALSAAAAARGILSTRGSGHAGFDIPGVPADAYLATQLRAIPFYVRMLLWPSGQCADWHFPLSPGLLDPPAIAGGALLAAAAASSAWLAVRAGREAGDGAAARRTIGFGVLLFLVVLLPSSSVLPLLDPVAEHRVYLASLGLFLAGSAWATWALRRFLPARAGVAGAAAAAVLLALAAGATAARSRVWTGSLALYQDALLRSPEKARVQMIVGEGLSEANRRSEALPYFRRALALSGDRTISPRAARVNIVATLLSIGRLDEARAEVDAFLRDSPGDPHALALLAQVEYSAARLPETEQAALAALRADPSVLMALKYLGFARMKRGDAMGALPPLRAAAARDAVDPQLFLTLGAAEERVGNLAGACRAYGRGSELPASLHFARKARAELARLGCR